jgi:hypothetical protein
MLDDSSVQISVLCRAGLFLRTNKDPLRDTLRTTRRYQINHHFVSYYSPFLRYFISPPSLAGSHQGNLGKICTGNNEELSHQPIQCAWGQGGHGQSLAAPLPPDYTGTSSQGNTSHSIQLTRNLGVCPYSTLVNKSARFFLVGM